MNVEQLKAVLGRVLTWQPEPRKAPVDAATSRQKTVFLGSGLGPMGRPGMTKLISSQAFRRGTRARRPRSLLRWLEEPSQLGDQVLRVVALHRVARSEE